MDDKKRFIVCPGVVVSRYDKERHFISAARLMELHHVSSKQCIIINRGRHQDSDLRGLDTSEMVRLFPRRDGRYKLYDKVS